MIDNQHHFLASLTYWPFIFSLLLSLVWLFYFIFLIQVHFFRIDIYIVRSRLHMSRLQRLSLLRRFLSNFYFICRFDIDFVLIIHCIGFPFNLALFTRFLYISRLWWSFLCFFRLIIYFLISRLL